MYPVCWCKRQYLYHTQFPVTSIVYHTKFCTTRSFLLRASRFVPHYSRIQNCSISCRRPESGDCVAAQLTFHTSCSSFQRVKHQKTTENPSDRIFVQNQLSFAAIKDNGVSCGPDTHKISKNSVAATDNCSVRAVFVQNLADSSLCQRFCLQHQHRCTSVKCCSALLILAKLAWLHDSTFCCMRKNDEYLLQWRQPAVHPLYEKMAKCLCKAE